MTDPLRIRPPQQRRSREAWARILDVGVALLEEGGYEALTIAAVSSRAKVAPRAIYDRAPSKGALLVAVYEHGMERIRAENKQFEEHWRWRHLAPAELISQAVDRLAATFRTYTPFLRAIILMTGVNDEIRTRGPRHSAELGKQFTSTLLLMGDDIDHADPEVATTVIFDAVFSSLLIRATFGDPLPRHADGEEAVFVAGLCTMAQRYLLGVAETDT